MITIITGDNDFAIREQLKKCLLVDKETKVIKYNLVDKEGSLNDFLNNCLSINLLANKCLYVVYNPYFFFNKISDKELKILSEYTNHTSLDNDIIYYSQGKSFDRRLKAYKIVKANAKEFYYGELKEKDFYSFLDERIKYAHLNLTYADKKELATRSFYNPTYLINNIAKLQLYPLKLDKEAFLALLPTQQSEDNFGLCEAFFRKDSIKLYKLLNIYRTHNDSFLPLISLLATQLRYLYDVSILLLENKKVSEIATILGGKTKSTYRVEKAISTLNYSKSAIILAMLRDLSLLDQTLKSDNKVSPTTQVQLFFYRWVIK